MDNWIYLTVAGLHSPTPEWPCVLWQHDHPPQYLSLQQACESVAGQSVGMIVPIELCSWWLSEKWPSRRRPSAQELAYAIEDQLGQDLDSLHIAVGKANEQWRYTMLIIERTQLRSLLQLLNSLGLEAPLIYVDADLLPHDQACAVWWDGRWIVGGAVQARLAMDDETLTLVGDLLPTSLNRLEGDIGQVMRTHTEHAINLRQGEFRLPGMQWPWRITTAALLVTLLIAWGDIQARSQFLEGQADLLYNYSLQRFKTLYPEQTRVVDLAAQLKALEAQGYTGRGTRLARLRDLSEQVLGRSAVQVQYVEYRVKEGWTVQLTAKNFAELERLRERAKESQLPVRLGGASKNEQGTHALLTLEDEAS